MSPADSMVDPLAFSLTDLAQRGGLVDAAERLVLLPEEPAAALGLPEELRLTPERADAEAGGAISCALGSPLLQRLVGDARALSLITYAAPRSAAVATPRPAQARALGERFVVRNGLCAVVESLHGESTYVSAHIAYVATADDRHDGLFQVVVHAADGAEPDEAVAQLLNPVVSAPRLGGVKDLSVDAAAALPFIARRAAQRLPALLQPLRDSAERRHRRDHARIADYYADLIREARSPRRRLEPAAVDAKVAHLLAERDAKLSDLPSRFALRVRLTAVALVCARLPVVRLVLQAQRRKLTRELYVRLPAGGHALDRLACDGCSGTTGRPALCDDRLHVLCEGCAPSAQGRPRCPACLRR